jgi:hypothetical protein
MKRVRRHTGLLISHGASLLESRDVIIEHEQAGESRAEYGKAVLEELSKKLTIEFGKSFSVQNLRYIRQFYQRFRKRHALRGESIDNVLRPELSWTNYRLMLPVESNRASEWYMNEAESQSWSTRQLDRQISTLHFGVFVCYMCQSGRI